MSILQVMVQNARRQFAAGKAKQAGQILAEVLRQKPDHAEALEAVWSIAQQTQEFGPATLAFAAATAASPASAMIRYTLSMALLSSGRAAEAETAVREAIAMAPGSPSPPMPMHLGRVLMALGRRDEAFAMLRQACELDPASATGWYNLGGVLLEHDRGTEAAVSQLLQSWP